MTDERHYRLEHLDEVEIPPDPDFVERLRGEITRIAATARDSAIFHNAELTEPTMVDVQESPKTTKPPYPKLRLAAAAVVIVIGGIWAALALTSADDQTPADALSTLTDETALTAAEYYFERYNAGDVDAVLDLLTPTAAIGDNFAGGWALSDWINLLAWNAGQGSDVVDDTCLVEQRLPAAIVVRCDGTSRDAVVRASGGEGVPTQSVLTMTTEGLAEIRFVYGSPDFAVVAAPFESWMRRQHPGELDAVGFQDWPSREEARASGEARARFADDWAASGG